ncbi:MAG TPA: MG2 domain-containing protein, partial [Polyangia bacterium]
MGLTTPTRPYPLRRTSPLHRRVGRGWLVIAMGLLYALAVPARAASWKEVERLTGEQKLEAAAAEVGKLRADAQKAGNDAEWARALIREVQLRTALHGYETAVRFLREQPWPKSQPARTALLLYQASSLVTYSQAYAWEIGQRERIASPAPTDLKTWTTDQIYAAATAAYVEIWKGREALGAEKVERFAEYLVPNNYPRDIRGTLRDAVSYLFVELLANSQGWRPEQANEVFALDLPALLKGPPARGPAAARAPRLDDPAVHPLVKVAAVLDDLEAWHLGRKELGAALETRLVRARTLFNHFTEDADRDVILADLTSRLASNRNVAWWAMGQGVLAELEEQRGHLARAHDAAAAGAKGTTDPESPGAQLCRALVGRLEAPSYQLESMQADGPRRRSVLVVHRNLPVLYLRAYRLDLDRRLAGNADVQLVMQSDEAKRLLQTKAAAEWSVPLPATPDYKNHRTYVTPPLDQSGLYGVVASGRADFSTADNVLQSVTLLVTNLVTTRRQTESGQQEITVLDGNTGAPVAGAEVTLYQYDYGSRGRTVEAKRTTDADGIARLSLATSRSRSYREYLAVARHGGQAAVDREPMQFWQPPPEADETSALVYTDRSIYRPLQKLLWKAVVFTGRRAQARLHTAAGHAVTISLVDPNGQVVDKREAKTNAYGSVAGEFAIPAGRPLGSWSVAASVGGQASVRVEEYKRPTFETKLNDPAAGLRLNKPATLTGEARYYFGLPVTHGQVRWRVTREPVYPFWWGWFWPTPRGHAVQTIATGTAAVDGAGRFTLAFTPKADERAAAGQGAGRGKGDGGGSPAVSFRYRVVADVTSEDGETRTA